MDFDSAAHLFHILVNVSLEQLQHLSNLMLENSVAMFEDDVRFWKNAISALAFSGKMGTPAAFQKTFQDPSLDPDPHCLLGIRSTQIQSICCTASCVDCGYCRVTEYTGGSEESQCCVTADSTPCSIRGPPCKIE